jgi:hypothetical protein
MSDITLEGCVEMLKEREDEIERLSEIIEEVSEQKNSPCGDALEKLWQDVMPKGYGDWEYPGMAYRHLKAEFNDKDTEIERLREWKEGVEGLLGQRGIENVSAMLGIMRAARQWHNRAIGGQAAPVGDLSRAVQAYEDMVASRALEADDG